MLFQSISMAVVDYACIPPINEYSNELKFLIMVYYTILQPRLHTLLSEYH